MPSDEGHTPDLGQTLLPIARAAISTALGRPAQAAEDAVWLQELGACFVTLTQQGQLRGCIGQLNSRRTDHDPLRISLKVGGDCKQQRLVGEHDPAAQRKAEQLFGKLHGHGAATLVEQMGAEPG